MNLPLRAITAVTLLTVFLTVLSHHVLADEQTGVAEVIIVVIDGRNGKPMAKQRLIVLNGPLSNNFLRNNPALEVWTDKGGRAAIKVERARVKWIAVDPDGRIVCDQASNPGYLLDMIERQGLATSNTCSKMRLEPKPGELIVYARPERFWESWNR